MCEDRLERGTPLQVDNCGEIVGLDRTGDLGPDAPVAKGLVDCGDEVLEWGTEARRDNRGAGGPL